jgi:hypothetical protein
VELPLVEATLKVNRGQPYRVVDGRRIYDPEVYSRMLKFKAIGLNYLFK